MNTRHLSRRRLLAYGIGGTAAVAAATFWTAGSPRWRNYLLEKVGDGVEPLEPELVGELDGPCKAALGQVQDYLLKLWEIDPAWVKIDTLSMASEKAAEPPSYLTEYRSLAAMLKRGEAEAGSAGKALADLFFGEYGDDPGSRIGRVRAFVLDQAARVMIATGGFRRFGYANYPGYMGGSFFDDASYRKAAVA